IGLYGPVNMMMGAVSTILIGGSMILCGQRMGKNETGKIQPIFSLSILLSLIAAVIFLLFHVVTGFFTDGSLLTSDLSLWPVFRVYLLGETIDIVPEMLGSLLAAFLSLENQTKRTTSASLIFIAVNVLCCFLFLRVLDLGVLGLALAESVGRWVFFLVQASHYFTKKSSLRFSVLHPDWKEVLPVIKIGAPSGMTYVYQSFRGIIVNSLILTHAGNAGLSAFTAANSFLNLFWAVPTGMTAVSRLLISVSTGEEDRQTLTDTMRTAMFRFVPLMALIDAVIILLASPISSLYFHQEAGEVYRFTVQCLRILPLCMPLSTIYLHFNCYYQSDNRQIPVHILAFLDGVASVAGFSALLAPIMGVAGVAIANVANGVVTTVFIIAYACMKKKGFPGNMDELMTIPKDFGVSEEDRMDIAVRSMEEVLDVSRNVQQFCLDKGLDKKRSYYAALFLEEMAGNVVEHGFTKDKKDHTVDIRVIRKGEDVLLRIKDDCIPFDPSERKAIIDPEDITKNIGIRMVYAIARKIDYQNILGLNVLTLHI
ncbi:MAG: ATP-binding protein, partial [Erysipelotrichaceae bacterium]|nr:ATP-binding protein [Erysipelotrichaceae bacterium]